MLAPDRADHELINGEAEAEMDWLKSIIVAVELSAVSRIFPRRRVGLILGNTAADDSIRITRHTGVSQTCQSGKHYDCEIW